MIKVLIIGYGSIGSRHARILDDLGCQVIIVSAQKNLPYLTYGAIEQACELEQPEYVVISTKTSDHHHSLLALLEVGYLGKILVEKPLFSHRVDRLSEAQFKLLRVGYQLRFHPVIEALYKFCRSCAIYSVTCYAGQYLPLWRPGVDYRSSYSISKKLGGGVLRDLSHELDYLQWCLGSLSLVAAEGGHLSDLDGDSEDVVALTLRGPNGAIVSLNLNYLDQPKARRFVIAIGQLGAFYGDLANGFYEVNGVRTEVRCDRNQPLVAMHSSFLAGEREPLCSYAEGLSIVDLIEQAEARIS